MRLDRDLLYKLLLATNRGRMPLMEIAAKFPPLVVCQHYIYLLDNGYLAATERDSKEVKITQKGGDFLMKHYNRFCHETIKDEVIA